jgi:hypothetical protein
MYTLEEKAGKWVVRDTGGHAVGTATDGDFAQWLADAVELRRLLEEIDLAELLIGLKSDGLIAVAPDLLDGVLGLLGAPPYGEALAPFAIIPARSAEEVAIAAAAAEAMRQKGG